MQDSHSSDESTTESIEDSVEGGPASPRAHKGAGSTVGTARGQRDWRQGLGWVDAKPTEHRDTLFLSIRRNPEPQVFQTGLGCEFPGRTRGKGIKGRSLWPLDPRGSAFHPGLETIMALLQMQVPGGDRLQLTPQASCYFLTSTDTGVPEEDLVVQSHPQCIVKTQILVFARRDHRLRRQ